ncbi:MAG: hypothetical protein HYU66_15595 [Armatimonadetes bacterium]|nr:hypothetical protein [Armatimonadota bacterium]
MDGPVWGWVVEQVEYRATEQDPWAQVTAGFTLSIEHPSTGSPDALLHANYETVGQWRAMLRVNVEYVAPETGERWSGTATKLTGGAPVGPHRPGSIWGKVIDATTGQPTTLVMVTCHEKNGGGDPAFNGFDANGYYDFGPVATGAYIVTAGQAIWASSTPDKYEFVFQEGQSARCDFVMHRWTMNRSLEIIEPHTNPIGGGQSACMRVSWREHVDPPKHIKLTAYDLTVPSLEPIRWIDCGLSDEGAATTAFNAQPQGGGIVMGTLGDPWLTTACFNDDYLVKAEVDFTNPWGEGDPHEEATKAESVRNMVIHNVQTSSGNADYLVYDPDPASGHSNPWLSFDIVDDAQTEPCSYHWYVTGLHGVPFDATVVLPNLVQEDPRMVRLNFTPDDLGPGRGVLSFEIHVEKSEGPGDEQWFRAPAKLTASVLSFYFRHSGTGEYEAWCKYNLHDDSSTNAQQTELDMLSPSLVRVGGTSGECTLGDHRVKLGDVPELPPPGAYTAVARGEDLHGFDIEPQHYREHQNHRILPPISGAAPATAYAFSCVTPDVDRPLFQSMSGIAYDSWGVAGSPYARRNGDALRDAMIEGFRQGTIFVYNGHGSPGTAGTGARVLTPPIPDAGIEVAQEFDVQVSSTSQMRLGAFFGCDMGAIGAIADHVKSKGAQCTFGWDDVQDMYSQQYCANHFWLRAMQPNEPVSYALADVIAEAFNGYGEESIKHVHVRGSAVLMPWPDPHTE